VADRDQREFVLYLLDHGAILSGGGLGQDGMRAPDGDVENLADAGLVRIIGESSSMLRFRITPEGEQYYAAMKTRAGEPVREAEDDVRSYLDSEPFRTRYPAAYRSFAEADRLLWGPDSHDQLTAVGRHAREALQEFATALVERHQPSEVNPNATGTSDRVSAVVTCTARSSAIGEATSSTRCSGTGGRS